MQRPGISDQTISGNGIRQVSPEEAKPLAGVTKAGLWIPYHRLDGVETGYGRLRINNPTTDMKYTQLAGSGCHVYFPKGLKRYPDTLGIVEGEFKALSLTEAGFPTVGISGFYGWQREGQVHSELEEALAYLQPTNIEWIGDSDTLLNPDYYTATSRMVDKLPSVKLVRMPFDGPKGADDMREEFGEEFANKWTALPRVEGSTDEVTMLDRLLTVHHEQVDASNTEVFGKLCKTIGRFGNNPGSAMLTERVRTLFKVKAGVLKEGVSAAKRSVERGDVVSEEAEAVVRRSYTDGTKWYVDLNASGSFKRLSIESWRNQLVFFGATAAQISNAQATVEQNRMVDYAGPLCGRHVGLHREGHLQLLVTEGYTFQEGTGSVEWHDTVCGQYLRNLLGESQCEYVLGWLKQARTAMREPHRNHPGQALFLVGGVGLGKTLAQRIISSCLGGRAADPQTWIKGMTQFNSDLWKAEHLMISDATVQDDWKARQRLTGAIKEIVANNSMPMNAKYLEPVTLKPIWRLSMSANTTPNSVRALPTVDEDNQDKLLMFYCDRPGWEFNGVDMWELIEPSIAEFCGAVDVYEVPEHIANVRYGVNGFVHPSVEALVHGESSEGQLEGVLDLYFVSNESALEGSSAVIYEVLSKYTRLGWIKSPRGMGMFLRRLQQSNSCKYSVKSRWSRGAQVWRISLETLEEPF